MVGFYQWTAKHEISGASVFVPYESSTDNRYRQHIYKVEWQAVKGNTLVTSLQLGKWDWNSVYTGFADGRVATRDIVTLSQSGDSLMDAVGTAKVNDPRPFPTIVPLVWKRIRLTPNLKE